MEVSESKDVYYKMLPINGESHIRNRSKWKLKALTINWKYRKDPITSIMTWKGHQYG